MCFNNKTGFSLLVFQLLIFLFAVFFLRLLGLFLIFLVFFFVFFFIVIISRSRDNSSHITKCPCVGARPNSRNPGKAAR